MKLRRYAAVLLVLLLPALARAEDEKPPKAAEIEPSIVAFLEAVSRASLKDNWAAIGKLFDIPRMVELLEDAGYLQHVPEKRRASTRTMLTMGLARAMSSRELILPFERFRVRSVSKGEHPDHVSVYVWLYDREGAPQKMRWHLLRRGSSWAIYDIEDLEFGLGILHLVGVAMVEAVGGAPAAWRGMGAKFYRAQELLLAGEFDEAQEILEELEALDLPRAFAAIVQMLLSSCAMGLGDYDEALAHLDQADELGLDAPASHYLRATIHNLEGEYETALRQARRYIERLDADPMVNLELGIALHGLGRKAEALVPLTAAIRETPDDAELLAYYALCLPPARHGELEERYKALSDPILGHRDVADVLLEHESAPLLRLFAGFFRKTHPQHYDVAHYEGHALFIEEKYKEAAAKFEIAQQAMFSAPESERPEDYDIQLTYLDALLDALIADGDPIGAYKRTLNPKYAFDYIAYELLYTKADAPLLRTYLAHVRKHPPENGAKLIALQVGYYEVEADILEQKPADALIKLRALQPAVDKAWAALGDEDDDRDEYQQLLWDVEDRYVRMLIEAKQFDAALELAKKIDARDEDLLYVAMVHVLRGEVAEASAVITRAVAGGTDPARFFEDEDLAEPLKTPAYAELRKKLLDEDD